MKASLPVLLIPVCVAAFAGFWCLVSKLISFFGWHRLATQFRTSSENLADVSFRLQHVQLGRARYNSVMKAGVSGAGLQLTVVWIFRVGHPPLLIPWSCIGLLQERTFLW